MIDRIKRGLDPDPPQPAPEPTVAELAERYMEAHVRVNCRPGTVEAFGRLVRLHVVPELGNLWLSEMDRPQVLALHHKLRDKPYQANQAVKVLARMFRLAEAWGMTPPRRNPCRSVRRYRRTAASGSSRPGSTASLAACSTRRRPTVRCFRRSSRQSVLLLLTGCRRNEIVTLRWDDVDRTAGELHIRDGKTGHRRVPLTPAVEAVLERIPRIEGNPWVITGQKAGDHLKNLDAIWLRLRERAGLHGVRIHDCRHLYASRALALGEGLPMIGRLLGHRKVTTTARLCAPGAGYREGVGGEGRRQHRRRPSAATRGCALRRKGNRHGEAHHDDDLEARRMKV